MFISVHVHQRDEEYTERLFDRIVSSLSLFRSEQDSYTTHSERSFNKEQQQRKYFSSGQENPDVEELIRAGYFMPEYKH